ncbi:MAG TPA: hypothetical protein VII99_10640 [Bacteroidia bacterium]
MKLTIKRRTDKATVDELKQDIAHLEKNDPQNLVIQFLRALLERKLREQRIEETNISNIQRIIIGMSPENAKILAEKLKAGE